MAKKYAVTVALEPEIHQRLVALTKVAPMSKSSLVRHAINVLLENPASYPVPLIPIEPKSDHITYVEVPNG